MSGPFIELLAVMKSLPLAYLKDMQEGKVYVFDEALSLELSAGSNDRDHW